MTERSVVNRCRIAMDHDESDAEGNSLQRLFEGLAAVIGSIANRITAARFSPEGAEYKLTAENHEAGSTHCRVGRP